MTILLLRVLWMKLTEEKKLHAFDISGRGKKGHTDGQKDRVPRGEPDVQANDSWSLTAGHVLQHCLTHTSTVFHLSFVTCSVTSHLHVRGAVDHDRVKDFLRSAAR